MWRVWVYPLPSGAFYHGAHKPCSFRTGWQSKDADQDAGLLAPQILPNFTSRAKDVALFFTQMEPPFGERGDLGGFWPDVSREPRI